MGNANSSSGPQGKVYVIVRYPKTEANLERIFNENLYREILAGLQQIHPTCLITLNAAKVDHFCETACDYNSIGATPKPCVLVEVVYSGSVTRFTNIKELLQEKLNPTNSFYVDISFRLRGLQSALI